MRWWRRLFPGRWTAAELLWIRVHAHQRWLSIQAFSDPPDPEFEIHDPAACWKCEAWWAMKEGL